MQFNNFIAASILAFAAVGQGSPVPAASPIDSALEGYIHGGGIEVDHADVDVVSRDLDHQNEPRAVIMGVLAIARATSAIGTIVKALGLNDTGRRREYTQRVSREMAARNPGTAVVVVNVGYATTGNVLHRQSVSLDLAIGGSVTFDVVFLGRGSTFSRAGDGGFENWAYNIPSWCSADRAVIRCT